MDNIRLAPRYLQGYHWNMFEETSIQLIQRTSPMKSGAETCPSKEQASSRTSKDGKEYAKHHIPEQKKIRVREKTKITDVNEQVRRSKWTWAGHVNRIRDDWKLRIATWKPHEKKRRWRNELDDYWKGTIWQRIALHRQMWKQHAEPFAQPRDTLAAQRS